MGNIVKGHERGETLGEGNANAEDSIGEVAANGQKNSEGDYKETGGDGGAAAGESSQQAPKGIT